MAEPSDSDVRIEISRRQWREGERRVDSLRRSDRAKYAVVENVIEAVLAELDRRVGQTFPLHELVDEYERSETWCQRLAHEQAPERPYAWDLGLVQDTAFSRFSRRAQDYQP